MEEKKEFTRNLRMDNLKGILIILVVMGHLLELDLHSDINRYFYILIYLFHMPAFIFISGYFASFKPKRIIQKLFYPYILFQFLYLLFARFVLHKVVSFDFTTPYWIMWYLLAMCIWSLSLALFQGLSDKGRLIYIMVSIAVAIGIGYVSGIGRWMSLSRIMVFYPFFLMGYYLRKRKQPIENKFLKCSRKGYKIAALFVCIVPFLYSMLNTSIINRNWLYEATGYGISHYTAAFRLQHLVIAALCIFILFHLIPDRKICWITEVGGHTFQVYLIHGFIIRLLQKYAFIKWLKNWNEIGRFAILCILSLVIVCILSGKVIKKNY